MRYSRGRGACLNRRLARRREVVWRSLRPVVGLATRPERQVIAMRRRFLLIPTIVALLGPVLVGQQPPEDQSRVTFRAEVNFVEVDAIVTDDDGNFVPGLTIDDFEIFEDGEPQDVTNFSQVTIPIEKAEQPLFADAPIEADVQTNAREYDGRLYMILLDDLHTAALRTSLVKTAARQFIENEVGANDQVAIIHTSGRSDVSQEFTNSRHRLLASIDKFLGRKLRSSALERQDRYNTLTRVNRDDQLREEFGRIEDSATAGSDVLDPLDLQRGTQAESMLRTLRASAELLTNVRGRRKTVLLISEGIDYDIYGYSNNAFTSVVREEIRDVMAAATRGNVAIYSVDPRGLTSGLEESIEMQAPTAYPTVIDISPRSFADEVRVAQDSLRVLSEETGGLAFVNSNDLGAAFKTIVKDNSSYYILGYYAKNDRRDGSFREIEVRLKQPDLNVRARNGYMAPSGKPKDAELLEIENASSELREVLNNPLQVAGLTMAATTASFKGERPNASVSVTVQLAGSSLGFVETDGKYATAIELSVMVLDDDGKIRGGDHQNIDMALGADAYGLVRQGGIRLMSRLDLKPGRYQLRVAGRETGGGRIGSVFKDLDVPDFSKASLSMSDIILSTIESTAGTPTARPDETLKPLLPGPPTTDRVFAADDQISLFVDVYDNEVKKPHKVDISTSVLSTEGTVIFGADEVRDSSDLAGKPGGYGHSATIPLQSLSPGLYVLKVEARSRLKADELIVKQVPFRVRPAGTPRDLGH